MTISILLRYSVIVDYVKKFLLLRKIFWCGVGIITQNIKRPFFHFIFMTKIELVKKLMSYQTMLSWLNNFRVLENIINLFNEINITKLLSYYFWHACILWLNFTKISKNFICDFMCRVLTIFLPDFNNRSMLTHKAFWNRINHTC